MSVSRCLFPFLLHLRRAGNSRVAIRDYLTKLPEVCSQPDCGEPRNCRKRCADYANAQLPTQKPQRHRTAAHWND